MACGEGRHGVCVVGLGMGYEHAKSYGKMDDVDLYVCDIDAEKVDRARRELTVRGCFDDVAQALECPDIQAIDAALPHDLHRDIAVRAAGAGKHFMSEKPLARTLVEADEMIEAAAQAGVRLMVAEGVRFQSSVIEARRLIDEGKLGEVFLVRVYQLESQRPSGWRLDRERTGGGSLIDSGVHAVHILRLLGGADVKLVFSQMTRLVLTEMEGEDTSVTVVRFQNGVVGNLISGWSFDAPMPEARFAVYGTAGCVWETWGDKGRLHFKSAEADGAGSEPVVFEVPKVSAFDAECRHFVDCIREGREPLTGPKEARADVELVVAAYRSAESETAVRLPL